MSSRREFLQLLAAAGAVGMLPTARGEGHSDLYDVATYGDVRLLHTCDIHAQLSPIYFREPHVNLGLHSARGKPPHLVGDAFLKYYNIASGSPLAHATTYLGMEELAARYGKAGGLAHLAHLIRQLRESYGTDKTMLLDSGDMWHGSATALYTMGADMVEAANLLGIDVITGHWEFTYPAETLRTRIKEFNGVFLAQNVFVKEDALFEGAEAYDEDSGLAFQPWVMRELGGRRIAVIGQAFPYTPIANPQRFIPDWTFGVRRTELQTQVEHIRANEKPDAVVLLSHNGADLDAQIAADVRGIDFILGGHTHDIFCQPRRIDNTMVFNSGCSGKFVGCLDIAFDSNGISDFHYHLLPVFANALPTDRTMAAHIETVRTPYAAALGEKLAIADETLYRRGNFNGTMDQVILDSLRSHYDAQIALSPGFRWGPSVLAGDAVRMEDVMNVTATTYPETYVREMHGEELKTILESVADNLYHPDPYYQQGGDMVRVGGMDYTLEPTSTFGTRIADMRLDSGKSIEANKRYTVAGWSTANPSDGPPMWEIMASYLRTQKTISVKKVNLPKLKGVANNSGIADYPKNLLVT